MTATVQIKACDLLYLERQIIALAKLNEDLTRQIADLNKVVMLILEKLKHSEAGSG